MDWSQCVEKINPASALRDPESDLLREGRKGKALGHASNAEGV